MEIIEKHIKINYSKGVKITPKYIVIHETDNERAGADAEAHFNYWNNNIQAQSSVHFIVDDKKVIQLLKINERAWHVGDNRNYSDITNSNTIGIEICVNKDGDFLKAYNNCIVLTKKVMKDANIPVDRVVRHYDASGKNCPRTIIANGKWEDFKAALVEKPAKVIQKKVSVALKSKVNNGMEYNQRIASIQALCNKLNITDYEWKKLIEDGIMGPRTKSAVQRLPMLKKWGRQAEAIRFLQRLFNIAVDGIFGNDTEKHVRQWQMDKRLEVDGIVGPITWLSFC